MTAGIDRVHIRCRAPLGREPEALALRTRLARTARTHLPDALRGTLERGGPRVYVERLDVALDFDPRAYDDVTVAALWARGVGDAVAALGDAAPGVRVFADGRAYASAALAELGSEGALSWVFAELPCGSGPVSAAALVQAVARVEGAAAVRVLLLEDPARAQRLYERMSATERAGVLIALGAVGSRRAAGDPGEQPLPADAPGALADARRGTPPARRDSFATWLAAVERSARARRGDGNAEVEPRDPAHAPAATPAAPPDLAAGSAPPSKARGAAPDDTVGAVLPHAAEPAAPRELRLPRAADTPAAQPGAPARAAADRSRARPAAGAGCAPGVPEGALARPGWWSVGGGLVLLWPWLGDLLAGELPPVRGLAGVPLPLAERMWALAGLLGEERAPFVPDPLVRLLAGDDLAIERPLEQPSGEPVPRAGDVLRSFAAMLPGFESAPDAFLRDHLLVRGALLEPLEDGAVRVRLEPRPLDPVLERLPYPLGPFRLDGTPLVVVERRRT